jgi:sugar-specific transcriptional regulator TrmB
MKTISETLTEAGLSPSAAEIYLTLVELGELTVPKILAKVQISRAMIYDVLPELMAGGYVEYRKDGKTAYYKPVHPGKLLDLVNQKKRDVALLEDEMKTTINTLSGTYNLALNKPGVRFFEGKEGTIEAYKSILELGQPIDSIEDKGEMAQFIPDYFPEFIAERVKKKIFNRVVAPSTNQINITSDKELRETRTIPVTDFPFSMDIKICGDTVLFATLKKESAIAIRIDEPLISDNLRLLFKFFWNHAAYRSSSEDKPNIPTTSSNVFSD